jgi:hypothetical protein
MKISLLGASVFASLIVSGLSLSAQTTQDFEKPLAPPRGGTLKVPHPDASKGLIRINKDGSYQYKTPERTKKRSGTFRVGLMAPPEIEGNGIVSYDSMYGSDDIFSIFYDYEWQVPTNFGLIGASLGVGFSTVSGSGTFENSGTEAREKYSLYMLPVSAFANYRFEYVRRQLIVPYITVGATNYTLIEYRDDGEDTTYAFAQAVGGGGGLLISISRLDPRGAFVLGEEYGIADMWLTLDARVMQGLNSDVNFTSTILSLGMTVDF